MFINIAQDFYLHKNKSFSYMKIYTEQVWSFRWGITGTDRFG